MADLYDPVLMPANRAGIAGRPSQSLGINPSCSLGSVACRLFRDAKCLVGTIRDASIFGFASQNKYCLPKHLSVVSPVLGRSGRKIPEHFIEDRGQGRVARFEATRVLTPDP